MKSRTEYEVQQHDGLKWHCVGGSYDLSIANTEYTALKMVWPDRCARILRRPDRTVVALHDPRQDAPTAKVAP